MIRTMLLWLMAGATSAGHTPAIQTGDVARFFRLYDATAGHPTAARLQHEYLDEASPGLAELARQRNLTGETIAAAIARSPGAYVHARECMTALPRVTARVRMALDRLVKLYPEANLPPVTIAVSRTKPVAMADRGGVRIGLEALCATAYLNPDVEERFVHVIAHEYAHAQQNPELLADDNPTVLEASLIEGVGEFTAELISGKVGNLAPAAIANGHEAEIERRFLADQDKKDLSSWLYNGTNTRPGDLGYWVGYRIVRAYYERSKDKSRALRDIFAMHDPHAFLRQSGWFPGISLPGRVTGFR